MTHESLVRDAAEAAKAVEAALAPVSSLVWGYDAIKDFVCARVAEKLRHVPSERIRTPEPFVAGPALEALRYAGHQESLRELYANLLATSLDRAACRDAHPSFVDMIKQLSPDEARIMRLFATRDVFPTIEIRLTAKESDGKETCRVLSRAFSLVGREAGCEAPDLTEDYLGNLSRLGLICSPGQDGLGATCLAAPGAYEPLESEKGILVLCKQAEAKNKKVTFHRSFVRMTELGQQFCRACVVEKAA